MHQGGEKEGGGLRTPFSSSGVFQTSWGQQQAQLYLSHFWAPEPVPRSLSLPVFHGGWSRGCLSTPSSASGSAAPEGPRRDNSGPAPHGSPRPTPAQLGPGEWFPPHLQGGAVGRHTQGREEQRRPVLTAQGLGQRLPVRLQAPSPGASAQSSLSQPGAAGDAEAPRECVWQGGGRTDVCPLESVAPAPPTLQTRTPEAPSRGGRFSRPPRVSAWWSHCP